MKHASRSAAQMAVMMPAAARGLAVTAAVLFETILWPAAASAQVQPYYHAGAWDAFSGRSESGGAVCGIGTTNRADGRSLSIRFDIGGAETNFAASKADWSIPADTRVTVVMQVGLDTPWTEQASGNEHALNWTLDRNAIQAFDRQFRGASSMTLTFPQRAAMDLVACWLHHNQRHLRPLCARPDPAGASRPGTDKWRPGTARRDATVQPIACCGAPRRRATVRCSTGTKSIRDNTPTPLTVELSNAAGRAVIAQQEKPDRATNDRATRQD